MKVAGVALSLMLPGCALLDTDDPDWLLSAHSSPNNMLIARLWCADRCDVPGRHTLTISAAARAIALEGPDVDSMQQGSLPEDDVVVYAYVSTAERGTEVLAPVTVRWAGNRRLQLAGRCLTDGNYRTLRKLVFRTISVEIVDAAPPGSCIQPPVDAPR